MYINEVLYVKKKIFNELSEHDMSKQINQNQNNTRKLAK